MATNVVEVTIRGISPLLMHRYPIEPVTALEKKTPDEQAEIAAYRDPDNKLFIPGIALRQALVSGATYSKGKGRGSLQKPVAACVNVLQDRLVLDVQEFTVDARPVVVPATKGRVMRFRPRFDQWSVTAEIEYDPDLLTEQQLRQVVDDTGKRVGLLDFRPERKGMFGRFEVVRWA